MASDVQSTLAQQKLNDYGSLVIIVAVSYDYCLTLSREVTYIWKRPWTWVSALFLFIRYAGYISVLAAALIGSTFIPGPVKVRRCSTLSRQSLTQTMQTYWITSDLWVFPNVSLNLAKFTYIEGGIVYRLGTWAYPIFWAGADMVMILRVYAMYNRSRIILGVLLVMYIAELVMLFVSSSIYSDPNYVIVSIGQLLDISVCTIGFSAQTWNNVSTISQFILGTVMCILVAAKFARHSLQMYQTTRKWEMNIYMRLLIRDSLLYFLVTLFYSLVNMLGILGIIPLGWVTQVLMAATNVPLYTLTPRFVMNVRELYALDSEGLRDRDIDTGFGLSSGTRRVGGSTTFGTMVFAEAGGIGGLDESEEIAIVEERAEQSK
ncbi:hypothetical protein V8E55_002728 [Tylopilus felleus]